MCAALMNVQQATTAELKAAINQKMLKWGGLPSMPPTLAELVQKGFDELSKRDAERA